MFNPVAPYRYLLPNFYFSVTYIANPDLFACGSRTWFSLDIARYYEEHCQPSSGSAWPACQKTVIGPHCWGREGSTQFTQGLRDRCKSSTAYMLCCLEPIPSLTVTITTLYTNHSLLPSLTVSITHCYHYLLLPSLIVTITHCYHHSLLPLLIVTITHCYHHSLLPSLTVTITHCYHHSLLPSLTVTITHC